MTLHRSDVLCGAAGDRGRTSVLVGLGTVQADPVVDVLGPPDLALREISYGFRELGAAGDLVRTLPADSAEADADLVSADEAEWRCTHASP